MQAEIQAKQNVFSKKPITHRMGWHTGVCYLAVSRACLERPVMGPRGNS